MTTVNVEGFSRAEVLAALYNHSKPLGNGFLHFEPGRMSVEEAEKLIEECTRPDGGCSFDYIKGRVMKVIFLDDKIDVLMYDRDNGQGAGERAILQELTKPT